MPGVLKRVATTVAIVLAIAVAGGSAAVASRASAFDASMEKVYSVPIPVVACSTDPAVLARGKHLVDSVTACTASSCHGSDLGGGAPIDMGPVALLTGPNVSPGGLGAAYSDGELARLIQYGLKKDGRSLRFMPAVDFCWLPDDDVAAIVSYLRTTPSVDRPNGMTHVKTLGKVLDRKGLIVLDVARRIDGEHRAQAVPRADP